MNVIYIEARFSEQETRVKAIPSEKPDFTVDRTQLEIPDIVMHTQPD